ncbi:PTS sugar transporter subunit IIA [Lactimicrobium sp.]|jgi:PTS system galactitol-specific IIA component|uniref:PTS sugar transporter subunit IIA n=1 Tax=Lactimicrobium sp. TaxID=2563780 RepID=UPI002F360335
MTEYIIKTGCEFISNVDVLKYGSSLLLSKGLVNKEYSDEIVKREQKYPTGIESHVNFAICHTEIQYSNGEAIAIITLKNPVEFRNMAEPQRIVPVQVVFMLASQTAEGHMKSLQNIVNAMQDEKTAETFLQGSDIDISKVIKEKFS